jgi:hypothetical protein
MLSPLLLAPCVSAHGRGAETHCFRTESNTRDSEFANHLGIDCSFCAKTSCGQFRRIDVDNPDARY